jgi:RHS repeat-associated protein
VPGATGGGTLAYAGQHWDADVGLSYAQQRWYQPETGRFLSEDPVFGDPSRPNSMHVFGYGNGNPLLYMDPEGTAGLLDLLQALAMPTLPWQSPAVRQTVDASREVVEQSPKVMVAAGAAPLLIAAAVPAVAAAVPAAAAAGTAVKTSVLLTAAKAGGAVVIAEAAVDAVGVGVGAHGCFVLQDPRSCLDMSASALDLASGPAPVAEALLADRATRRKGLKGPTGAPVPAGEGGANASSTSRAGAGRVGPPDGEAAVTPMNTILYSMDEAPSPPIQGPRQKAIDLAWLQEVELVKQTGRGTRPWSQRELDAIKKGAKYGSLGYTGHHINRVKDAPEWEGDPRNIFFLRQGSGEEHMTVGHPGGTRAPQPERPLVDRKATLKSRRLLNPGG